jgi:Ca-activated chloride channel family protein
MSFARFTSTLVLNTVPLNLAIVIDASGSMGGGKLEAAKQATALLVERLGPRDTLTVVSFASEVLTHAGPALLDAGGKRAALEAISGLQPRDSTDLCGGWQRGADSDGFPSRRRTCASAFTAAK